MLIQGAISELLSGIEGAIVIGCMLISCAYAFFPAKAFLIINPFFQKNIKT